MARGDPGVQGPVVKVYLVLQAERQHNSWGNKPTIVRAATNDYQDAIQQAIDMLKESLSYKYLVVETRAVVEGDVKPIISEID